MASTIVAGNITNGGTAISSDSTGILDIKTGTGSGTTAISINASQYVNMPIPIQSITASVAANALTISTGALFLNFRSTTATTGAITTVTGTPANLVVPANQAYTVATTGVTNRYAVLCFNNAGTLALGLSILSGGVQLDETNFLSPTSTVTNTGTAIYSTITASNLAYRVIGFVDIAYTSGTGYSVAPTLVQGQGGQALGAMSSIGYSQTWSNVTGSRALGTTYYNTTGRPIMVYVRCTITSVGNVAVLTINSAVNNVGGNAAANGYGSTTTGIVPPGQAYVVPAIVGGGSITEWNELR
jgi:hypothetical protein